MMGIQRGRQPSVYRHAGLLAFTLHALLPTPPAFAAAPSPVGAIAGAWDQAARLLPGATVLDATLTKGIAGADLRLQLLS